ncbi:MAG: response regulator [Desulfobacula sp.]|nr:response regulator [Desulfobacula sp.]
MSENKNILDCKSLSILVVDDMKSMRQTIRKMLKSLDIGTVLLFAENGRDGLRVLRSSKCDLVIVDWNMPVMNGITMLEKLRDDPALRDLPVIMVTAEAERDIVSEVAEIEVDGYLLKPLTLKSLDTKIKTVINKMNHPDQVTRYRKLARGFEENGDYGAAVEQIRKALKHKPNASRLLRQMGLLHFRLKKNKIAEKCLLKAVSVNNQDTISLVYLADYYLKRNDLKKAANFYLRVLSLSAKYNDRAFDIGKKLLKNNLRSLSLGIFSKVLVQSKKQNAAREQIIDICLSNNEFEYPKELLEQAIKENPSNYDMVFRAGQIFIDAGDWEKALRYFENVDRHVRGHVEAKLQIAKIYYMNRRIYKADDYLNQILRIEPNHEEAIVLRREL